MQDHSSVPDPKTMTTLQCDARLKGLGAWEKVDCTGKEHIVGMCSRTLHYAETRYSNIERECLAVKYGLEKFEYYLMGRTTIVEIDNSPLEQTFKKNLTETPNRLTSMMLKCLRFDTKVGYKPGIKITLHPECTTKTEPTAKLHHVNFIAESR